ncbi:MAG TPA: DNA-processing protein DprA, partial [Phycisphaerales bacterium]|nr:DNA-processing protein DprA [Phycisphaerales bacterium]
MGPTEHDHAMLRLAMTPGLGPVLAQRAVARLGSPQAVLDASEHTLATIKGIGEARARQIRAGAHGARDAAAVQLNLAARLGVSLITIGSPEYPELLGQIPSPPLVLWVRGRLDASDLDRHAVAIVGSRECSTYGLEQAGRFARGLAQSGIT